MPAKITDGPTDSYNGLINISDVHRIINDYITKLNLTCADPTREPIQKHYYFDVSLDKINKMIKGSKGAANNKKFRINLVLNLPNQLNCDQTFSIENYLSILICGISKAADEVSLLKVKDFVLCEGFNDVEKPIRDDSCCVQGTPPKGK